MSNVCRTLWVVVMFFYLIPKENLLEKSIELVYFVKLKSVATHMSG